MQQINAIIGYPFGFIIWAIYKVIPNYGIALLIFTMITRLAMIPMAIKQQKSSIKMTVIQPQLKEIQDKYKDNKEKLQEEMSKLYQKEGYNPMSGCLPMVIQFPILFGVIDVVYRPMTHILRLSKELIELAKSIFQTLGYSVAGNSNMLELQVFRSIREMPMFYSRLGENVLKDIFAFDFSFLGLNLMETPSMNMITGIFQNGFNPVILIPILSGVTSLIMSMFSMKTNPSAGQGADKSSGCSMKAMMYFMPIMSFGIALSVPAGVGLYWIYSNLFAILQSIYMNKKYNIREMADKAKAEREDREKLEKEERKEARKLLKEKGEDELDPETKQKAISQKEASRRKLAEARKRDAEKYGEDYVEVTDEDLK